MELTAVTGLFRPLRPRRSPPIYK